MSKKRGLLLFVIFILIIAPLVFAIPPPPPAPEINTDPNAPDNPVNDTDENQTDDSPNPPDDPPSNPNPPPPDPVIDPDVFNQPIPDDVEGLKREVENLRNLLQDVSGAVDSLNVQMQDMADKEVPFITTMDIILLTLLILIVLFGLLGFTIEMKPKSNEDPLSAYIKNNLDSGFHPDAIRKALFSKGYTKHQIEYAFHRLRR